MNLTSAGTAPAARFFSIWLVLLTGVWAAVYLRLFPDPGLLFVQRWPLILIGVMGAIIGNLTAIGGGIVFIPVLIFGYHLDPVSALKLAFVTQSMGMTSGASGWLQRREVPLHALPWTIPSLILGSVISTFLFHPQPLLVKGLFGPLAFLTGLLTLLLLDRKGHRDRLPRAANLPLFLVSCVGGLVTGWVAIGEGEIIAAFCMLAYGLNASKAIGLGVVLLSVNSILLALTHALYFGGVPWDLAVFTMLGALWGGRLGPFVARRFSVRAVKRVFAWIAMVDGLLVMFQVSRAYL